MKLSSAFGKPAHGHGPLPSSIPQRLWYGPHSMTISSWEYRSIHTKWLHDQQVWWWNPKKLSNSFQQVGIGHSTTALMGSSVNCIPVGLTLPPRNLTSWVNNSPFCDFSLSLYWRNLVKTSTKLVKVSSNSSPTTLMSSKDTITVDHIRPDKTELTIF